MKNDEKTATKIGQEMISVIAEDSAGEMMQITRKLEELYNIRDTLSDKTDIGLMNEYISSLEDKVRLIGGN